ncbi:MAG: hydroxymethylglutaryl-CoA lyase [Gammaproteobacteria bacterium]|nr:hydroxymethylglutaryl-CoA lyase [Gammaproteobacteria bacterium]
MLPAFVKIVEVGPRDGLQNEKSFLPTADKIDLINRLSDTGLSVIEATSFVSPEWIPQLKDQREVFQGIEKKQDVSYPVLVPNKRGMENAIAAGAKEVAVFSTPSETFSQRNTNCSVAESLQRIEAVMQLAEQHHMRVRGYLSCIAGCPYEGAISPVAVTTLSEQLLQMGVAEISLGDTIGVGTPKIIETVLDHVLAKISTEKVAVHFHDTYGQALVNIYVALKMGIHMIDSSIAGLGGCPYAKGASGNVATEDVVYMLHGLGIETHIDLKKLIEVGCFITQQLGTLNRSRVSAALIAN